MKQDYVLCIYPYHGQFSVNKVYRVKAYSRMVVFVYADDEGNPNGLHMDCFIKLGPCITPLMKAIYLGGYE